MQSPRVRTQSSVVLVVVYAVVTFLLVLLLGVALALGFRSEAERRGLAEGTSEAELVAHTALEPVLGSEPIVGSLTQAQQEYLTALSRRALGEGHLLRLRLRDMSGQVVFSDDGSGFSTEVEDDVLEALEGRTVSLITHVNVDANDTGPAGEDAVEVYLPLTAADGGGVIGVLEVYLPYAPIEADVSAGMNELYVRLAVGLAVLYVALFLVSLSVSRGLRRQLRVNAYLAEHDTLTGLPNRGAFAQRLDDLVAGSWGGRRGAGEGVIAAAIIDLDRFKDVNDALGHEQGDRMLVELARRLSEDLAGTGDLVARLGGDEFGVILVGVTDPGAILWRLRELIEEEVTLDGLPPLTLNSSIGYVVAPEDGTDAEVLLQRADIAMYVAKRQHAGVSRYDARLDRHDPADLSLVSEVRRALEGDELVLHYQPKVSLPDRGTVALEALVRWDHPQLGLLPPDRFIPLVEQTDLIHPLTDWVLARALHDLGTLEDAGLTVAVNVSARNLARPDFADRVAAAIQAAGVDPRRVVVEITETALLTSPQRASRQLDALDALGVSVSLDDFGVGQTSLSYLATLPVAELKVDRSFVTDMTDNPTHEAIVRSIVDLAHSLGMRVVAEGVETADAGTVLDGLGCDEAQGYHFSRPLTVNALRGWLEENRAGAAPSPGGAAGDHLD